MNKFYLSSFFIFFSVTAYTQTNNQSPQKISYPLYQGLKTGVAESDFIPVHKNDNISIDANLISPSNRSLASKILKGVGVATLAYQSIQMVQKSLTKDHAQNNGNLLLPLGAGLVFGADKIAPPSKIKSYISYTWYDRQRNPVGSAIAPAPVTTKGKPFSIAASAPEDGYIKVKWNSPVNNGDIAVSVTPSNDEIETGQRKSFVPGETVTTSSELPGITKTISPLLSQQPAFNKALEIKEGKHEVEKLVSRPQISDAGTARSTKLITILPATNIPTSASDDIAKPVPVKEPAPAKMPPLLPSFILPKRGGKNENTPTEDETDDTNEDALPQPVKTTFDAIVAPSMEGYSGYGYGYGYEDEDITIEVTGYGGGYGYGYGNCYVYGSDPMYADAVYNPGDTYTDYQKIGFYPFNLGGVKFAITSTQNSSGSYDFTSISSSQYGLSFAWSWSQTGSSVSTSGNQITIDVSGNIEYNIFFQGIGKFGTSSKSFRLTVNRKTGKVVNVIPL